MTLKTPLEHYRFCRELLLRDSKERGVEGGVLSDYKKAARYPFAESFQPSAAVLALLAKRLNLAHPPIIPKLYPNGAPVSFLPLPVAWQLASYWNELGEFESAARLKDWVSQIGSVASFLYYPEESFDLSEVEEFGVKSSHHAVDAQLGLVASQFGEIESCFTLTGKNTGLGALRLGSVHVPSLGPQLLPLSDTRRFGIMHPVAINSHSYSSDEKVMLEGWTKLYGNEEICLHLQASTTRECIHMDVRLLGIEATASTFMAFYVSAETCAVEGEGIYHPGALQGYRGKKKILLLDRSVQMSASGCTDMQVIPLAANSCFWNASFLVVFELNYFNYSCSISFKFI